MSDTIYRLDLWRFGEFPIKAFEVVSRTPKTVVVKIYHSDNKKDGYCENRYYLFSGDYAFFDTLGEVNLAAENVIVNRLRYEEERVETLRARLQEVCQHKAITSPAIGGRCVRCDFEVLNPEDYCDGG